MGWVDEVPRSGGVYIGGLQALFHQQDLFRKAGITHILSVLDYDINNADRSQTLQKYTRLQLRLEDDPNEDLLQHFSTANAFVAEALERSPPGRVFVHCAMGKSRSATVVCAYLMWRFGVSPVEALAQVCEGRPVCSPNPGFMEQLEVYHQMLTIERESGGDAEAVSQAKAVYDAWLEKRFHGDAWEWEKRREQKLLTAAASSKL